MRIEGKVDVLKFDMESYSKTFKKEFEIHTKQAARAFVLAAIPAIPVQTGMARGSYLNVGRFLNINIPIPSKGSYQRTRKGRTYTVRNPIYYSPTGVRMPKTPESGAALTAFVFETKYTSNGIEHIFRVNSKVFHYTLQDEMHVRSPTSPWYSMRKGRDAWINYMQKIEERLPSVKEFIGKTTISFGRGSAGLTTEDGGRLRVRRTFSG